MSHFLKVTFALLLGVLTLQTGFSQRTGNSPYSRIGLGDIAFPGFAPSQAMGGAGVSFANGIFINNLNPALLARNRSTTFDAGVYGQFRFLKTNQALQREPEGNLSYVSLAFPLLRPNLVTGVQKVKWTTGITLAPYSSVNYSGATFNKVEGSTDTALVNYEDTGGLTGVSFNNGFNIFKKLYVGLQATYLFGVINNETTAELYSNDPAKFAGTAMNYRRRTNYSDFVFKPGVAYRDTLNKNLLITLGGTVDLPANLNARRLDRIVPLAGPGIEIEEGIDTLGSQLNGTVKLPAAYRFGVTLDRPFHWALSADVAYHQWADFRSFDQSANLKNTVSVALGGEWTPNINSINNYLSRSTYRAGFQYSQMPISSGGKQLRDVNVSAGAFFPITPADRRTISYLNVVFTAGQRGTLDNLQIRERYVKMTLAFTLNDFGWFVPRRVD